MIKSFWSYNHIVWNLSMLFSNKRTFFYCLSVEFEMCHSSMHISLHEGNNKYWSTIIITEPKVQLELKNTENQTFRGLRYPCTYKRNRFLPVFRFPSNHAGPFGTTDLICRNSSTLSSPPTIVNPRPCKDLTSWVRIRSPRKWFGSRVKNGAEN